MEYSTYRHQASSHSINIFKKNSVPFFSQNIYADFTLFYHRLFSAHCICICKQLVIWGSRNTERSGLFHSWYTDPSLQGKEEQCNSQVSHHRPCRRREPCHRLGLVDREAQRQTRWIKEALWIRKTPMCMNRDAGSYQLSHTWDQLISRSRTPSSCKQSKRDQDVRRTSKRCH